MRILIANDDGFSSEGIKRLAIAAKAFGEVWLVAPDGNRSAMSQRITIHDKLILKKLDYPVEGVHAYSLSGSPADCVKVAISNIMPEKPDIFFSGINNGFNTGGAIAYSATVGCAIEAKLNGIRAIAFSNNYNGSFETCDKYIEDIIRELMKAEIADNEIWNVNFPGCQLKDCKGILRDRHVAKNPDFVDRYDVIEENGDTSVLMESGYALRDVEEGSDCHAVFNNYISIGKIKSMTLSS